MTDSNLVPQPHSGNPFPEIRGNVIRVDDVGRVSLTDVWKAAGSTPNKDPSQWGRLPDTLKSVDALALHVRSNGGFSPNEVSQGVIATKRGGTHAGTWAHPNLAIQYAGYLSPDLRVEIHDVFLRYKLADPTLADEVLDRATPEDNEWAGRRALGRKKRVEFTGELAARGVEGRGFADCTNANYRGLYGKDAAGLRQERGLPAKGNVRDSLDSSELVAVMLSEDMARRRMQALDDRGNTNCARSCFDSSRNLKRMLEEEERQIQEERERRGIAS